LTEKQKSLKYVSSYLGHASVEVTVRVYIHDAPDDRITELF